MASSLPLKCSVPSRILRNLRSNVIENHLGITHRYGYRRSLTTLANDIGSEQTAIKSTEYMDADVNTALHSIAFSSEKENHMMPNPTISTEHDGWRNQGDVVPPILTQTPATLETIRDASTLAIYVDEIESISPLRSEHLQWIYSLMVATSKQCSVNGARLTERLLAACLASITSDRPNEAIAKVLPYPNRGMYTLAITAWTKANISGDYGAKEATKLLELMAKEYKQEVDFVNHLDHQEGIQRPVMAPAPHLINYTNVIDAWAKSQTIGAPLEAQQLLDDLEHHSGINDILSTGHMEGNFHPLTPDLICYNLVMSAWCRSTCRDAIQRGERIIERLKKLHAITGDAGYRLNVHTYSILINMYGKQRGSNRISRPMEAEQLLKDMYDVYTSKDRVIGEARVKPNIVAYNSVMQVWANAGNPQRAEAILMAIMGREGGVVTVPVVPRLVPTMISFHIVIHGWARHGGPEAGERAEAILNLMGQVKDADGIPMPIKPMSKTFNAVMNAWSRSNVPHGADRAESILTSLLDQGSCHKATSVSFVTALHAHAMSPSEGGAKRAEQLLHKHKVYYLATNNDDVRPDEPSYASVLLAWTLRSASTEQVDGLYAAEHAELLLMRFENETGKKPSFKMLHDALDAWSRHDPTGILVDGPNKVNRARLLLHRLMLEYPHEMTETTTPFCIMLRACSAPTTVVSRRREAVFTAIDSYNRLQRDSRFLTHWRIYEEMFKMLKVHFPEKSDVTNTSVASTVFQDCCNDGWLSPSVIEAALGSNHLSDHVISVLTGHLNDRPRDWSHKVKQRHPKYHPQQ